MKTRLGSTRQGKFYLALSFVLLTGSIVAMAAHVRRQGPLPGNTPIYTTGTDVADPNQVGNINQAMQQSQQLLTALQAVNFDPTQLMAQGQSNLMFLPDQQYAEQEAERASNATAFCFPDSNTPEQSQIAFFSDIYARRNISYYNGDTSSSQPSGFYIVAWKNGTIQQVPVSAVRLLTTADGTQVDCFPGMTGYDPSLPAWGN